MDKEEEEEDVVMLTCLSACFMIRDPNPMLHMVFGTRIQNSDVRHISFSKVFGLKWITRIKSLLVKGSVDVRAPSVVSLIIVQGKFD